MSILDKEELKLIITISERLSALEIMVMNLRLQADRVDKDVQTMISSCNIEEKDQRKIDKEIERRITSLEKREIKYISIFTTISVTVGVIVSTIWALFSNKIIAFFK